MSVVRSPLCVSCVTSGNCKDRMLPTYFIAAVTGKLERYNMRDVRNTPYNSLVNSRSNCRYMTLTDDALSKSFVTCDVLQRYLWAAMLSAHAIFLRFKATTQGLVENATYIRHDSSRTHQCSQRKTDHLGIVICQPFLDLNGGITYNTKVNQHDLNVR